MSYNSKITRCDLFVLMCLIFPPVTSAAEGKPETDEEVVWGTPTQGMSASISTPKDTYVVGEPIPITYRIKNDSKGSVWITYSGLFRDFDVEVTGIGFGVVSIEDFGRKGKRYPIPLTVYGKQREFLTIEASGRIGKLFPKTQSKAKILPYSLSRIYDMSIAGEYEIKVSRRIYYQGTTRVSKVVESNVLKIKVTNPTQEIWD